MDIARERNVSVLSFIRGSHTHDRITTLASPTDGAVRRISTTYEVRGMVDKVTSYDNHVVGSGSVVNEVQHAYNSFGQLTTQYQEHGGGANTSTSPKVQYAYADGSANHVRPTKITYPSGRIVRYEYNSGACLGSAETGMLAGCY
jgi:hypothetical protein